MRSTTSAPMPMPTMTAVAPRKVPMRRSGKSTRRVPHQATRWGGPCERQHLCKHPLADHVSAHAARTGEDLALQREEGKRIDPGADDVNPLDEAPRRSCRFGPPLVRVSTTSPLTSGGMAPSFGRSTVVSWPVAHRRGRGEVVDDDSLGHGPERYPRRLRCRIGLRLRRTVIRV